ncbi:putative DNA-binding protein [Bacillus sp. TS-2]|nr:putative DNA-binding protein [Bacillus sp. TS-2]
MIKTNEESKLDKRMKLLLNYVHENYPHKFSLEDLAKGAYMSVSECCKLFNSYISMTPFQYLTYYRLN